MSTEASPAEGESLDGLVARVDRAADGAGSAVEVWDRLLLQPGEEGSALALVGMAFLYDERSNRHADSGAFFGPLSSIDGNEHPPSFSSLEQATLELWAECAARVQSPIARARLNDICFEARVGNRLQQIRAAIEAYLDIADRYPSEVDEQMRHVRIGLGSVHALRRALDIARSTRQEDLAERVITCLADKARVALNREDAGAGVVLGFLDALAHDRGELAVLADLLDAASVRYSDDLWNAQAVIELRLARAGKDEQSRSNLLRQSIELLLDEATKVPTLHALAFVRDAAERAERYGFSDLRDRAVTRLQELAKGDQGLTRRVTNVSLSREAVEGMIEQLVGLESWQDCLAALVSLSPPTGEVSQNRIQASNMGSIAPFFSRIATQILGPDGLPRVTVSGEEREAYNVVWVEKFRLQVEGPLRAEVLRRAGTKWGVPTEQDAAAFFGQHEHVSTPLAEALGRALVRYFRGDFEGAAFTAVPRIERLAREMLLAIGAPVFRVETQGRPGGFLGLGALLGALAGYGLNESWLRYIDTLLSRQEGLNYRNELLHGSVDDVGEVNAALVLIAAVYLAVAVRRGPTT